MTVPETMPAPSQPVATTKRLRILMILAVAALQAALSYAMISVVYRLVADQPFLAALFLFVSATALSLLAYVLLNQEMLKRLRNLRSGLTAEQQARNAAEQAAQEKSRLLATMTHEIRTPLNGVIGMLGLLLEGEMSAEQRNYAETAHGSSRILLSIIDEILDGAKSEALRRQEKAPVDIIALVENVTELLAPRAHAKGIEIASLFAPDVPQIVTGDDMRIRQVLFNLAGNAIKFTEKGGISIRIERHGADGLAFRVQDTGIGMSEEELARLFKPFAQANDQTRRRFGGTGLGLAISLKLVNAMGGQMTAKSKPQDGTIFSFTLPALIKPDQDRPPPQKLSGRRFRLLVQSDFIAEGLAAQIMGLGGEALPTARADAESLKAHLRNSHEAVICDGQFAPDVIAAAKRLSRKGQALPQIWLLLSPDERRSLRHLLQAPVTGFLMRPVRCATLVEQLTSRDTAFIRTATAQLRTIATRGRKVQTLHVLLTDDTPVNTVIAKAMLEKAGHRVTTAYSGAAALEAIKNGGPFDILLLDMEMPGLSGPETAAIIREQEARDGTRARLPILALTANTRPEAVEACLAAGMDGHLAKPFDGHDLAVKMARITRKAAA